MNNSRPDRKFPCHAILSAALSLLSLYAYALLLAPGEQTGQRPAILLTVAWLAGAGAGVLLFLWARRNEPKIPVGIAGMLALATGLTLFAGI